MPEIIFISVFFCQNFFLLSDHNVLGFFEQILEGIIFESQVDDCLPSFVLTSLSANFSNDLFGWCFIIFHNILIPLRTLWLGLKHVYLRVQLLRYLKQCLELRWLTKNYVCRGLCQLSIISSWRHLSSRWQRIHNLSSLEGHLSLWGIIHIWIVINLVVLNNHPELLLHWEVVCRHVLLISLLKSRCWYFLFQMLRRWSFISDLGILQLRSGWV